MGGYHEFETSLKLGGQKVVLVLTIQMSAYFCAVLKNSYFRHCSRDRPLP